MKIDELRLLHSFHHWANARLLDFAQKLPEDVLVAPGPAGAPSLRFTLVHVIDSDNVWRSICRTGEQPEYLTEEHLPTLAAIRARRAEEDAAWVAYLDGLRDDDLERIVQYTIEGGVVRRRVLWHCLWHVVNHGTHHRAQIGAILRANGQPPGDIDFTMYLNERAGLE